jgi:hypothetical protein
MVALLIVCHSFVSLSGRGIGRRTGRDFRLQFAVACSGRMGSRLQGVLGHDGDDKWRHWDGIWVGREKLHCSYYSGAASYGHLTYANSTTYVYQKKKIHDEWRNVQVYCFPFLFSRPSISLILSLFLCNLKLLSSLLVYILFTIYTTGYIQKYVFYGRFREYLRIILTTGIPRKYRRFGSRSPQ